MNLYWTLGCMISKPVLTEIAETADNGEKFIRTDSQHYQNFGMQSDSKVSGRRQSQNLVTFTCRLNIADKKRRSRWNLSRLADLPLLP